MTTYLKRQWPHCAALVFLGLWCLPYLVSGRRTDHGDFVSFCQAYEAIRQSIVHYHQFPWMNPWVAGGMPLFADPQVGVFSIQTPLVIVFGAPLGLKISVVAYTLAGYFSMSVLLRRFFRIDKNLTLLLSLLWVVSSFFAERIPSQFTFVWYLVSPFYVYLALTLNSWRRGVGFGAAFAVMALAQVHNPFVMISAVCGSILVFRFIREDVNRRYLLWASLFSALTFTVLAGIRIAMVLKDVGDFPRQVSDPAAPLLVSLAAFVLPYSAAHPGWFPRPDAPFLFGEVTCTLGLGFALAVLVSLVVAIRQTKKYQPALGAFFVTSIFVLIGVGHVAGVDVYGALKHLPVFDSMRVSSRWFIFATLSMVVFVALVWSSPSSSAKLRRWLRGLLVLGLIQAFALNFGSQNTYLQFDVQAPNMPEYRQPFEQTYVFGDNSGGRVPAAIGPQTDREYEATLYNLGVLRANTALSILDHSTTRCTLADGCDFVLSNNATVKSWSPNRIVLDRTGPGPIELNLNDSVYYKVNGQRRETRRVAEPFKRFLIDQTEISRSITISARPGLGALFG